MIERVNPDPLLVAAAVVFRGDKVLLTQRRPEDTLGGYWEFPGGKVRSGEAPGATVVRECREECAIELGVIDIFDVTYHADSGRNILLFFYECRLVSGDIQHLEVADHVWCGADTFDTYRLPPADVQVVAKVMKRLRA